VYFFLRMIIPEGEGDGLKFESAVYIEDEPGWWS
jgi:hypothetical protein